MFKKDLTPAELEQIVLANEEVKELIEGKQVMKGDCCSWRQLISQLNKERDMEELIYSIVSEIVEHKDEIKIEKFVKKCTRTLHFNSTPRRLWAHNREKRYSD